MKYTTNELYVRCFERKDFDKNEDKFLIGLLNDDRTMLQDVVTQQVVEVVQGDFINIARLKTGLSGGSQMALGYMTGRRATSASPRQKLLAQYINSILAKDEITEKEIAKIKKLIGNEVVKTHKKDLAKKNNSSEQTPDEPEITL